MKVNVQNKCVIKGVFLGLFLCTALNMTGATARADEGHGKSMTQAVTAGGLQVETQTENPMIAGIQSGVMLRLGYGEEGLPLFWDELAPVHDSRIHLLIIDRALADYHHEHPERTDTEGQYAFFVKPQTSCAYKVWGQVFFKDGRDEWVQFTLPGRDECADAKPDKTLNDSVTVDGYTFTLKRNTDVLKKGADTLWTLSVTDKNGEPFELLEPVMGAYAHLVGFYDDYETIAHIHPMGEEPSGIHDRGGPDLSFHFQPARSGFMKLFAQVKINNRMIFAPFGVEITE